MSNKEHQEPLDPRHAEIKEFTVKLFEKYPPSEWILDKYISVGYYYRFKHPNIPIGVLVGSGLERIGNFYAPNLGLRVLFQGQINSLEQEARLASETEEESRVVSTLAALKLQLGES